MNPYVVVFYIHERRNKLRILRRMMENVKFTTQNYKKKGNEKKKTEERSFTVYLSIDFRN